MKVTAEQIRSYRLHAHHLDKKLDDLHGAAGACGLQNTPPGSWETSMFNRIEGCTLAALDEALCKDKTLLQAWSYRGVPLVFPAEESDIFLSPLQAQEGEEPWIYTQGITGALDFLNMGFDDLLSRLKEAIAYLDSHTIKSKEALDRVLADEVEKGLPEDRKALWRSPSIYGNPDKQTMGGAAVSFLLRPCSFSSLVVFGERQGSSPTFTSYANWLGRKPVVIEDADKRLVRKFLHCYGPARVEYLQSWLGCSPKQARRLWERVSGETVPVQFGGKTHYMLQADMDCLLGSDKGADDATSTTSGAPATKLMMLGTHDPYLDMRDRTIILEDKARHKAVWKYVANPGVVLRGGRIIGTWKVKTLKGKLDIFISIWEALTEAENAELMRLAGEYAGFRMLPLRGCKVEGA